jgi:hypothetical protein
VLGFALLACYGFFNFVKPMEAIDQEKLFIPAGDAFKSFSLTHEAVHFAATHNSK